MKRTITILGLLPNFAIAKRPKCSLLGPTLASMRAKVYCDGKRLWFVKRTITILGLKVPRKIWYYIMKTFSRRLILGLKII